MWLCRIGWLHLDEGYVVRTSVLFFVAVLVVLVVLGRLGQVVLRVLKLFAQGPKLFSARHARGFIPSRWPHDSHSEFLCLM